MSDISLTLIKAATQASDPVADSAAFPANVGDTDRYVDAGQLRKSGVRTIVASGAQSGAGASRLHLVLNHASIINYTITGAPEVGDTLTVFIETAVAHTLVLSGAVSFDGTNQTCTFAAKGNALYMVARTVGLWDIIKNDGSLSA